MATVETCTELSTENGSGVGTAYLVVDTESIPDGRLISRVKYPDENLSEEEAIARAQTDARETSYNGSDFLPVTFQYPIAVCVARVGSDYRLQGVRCIDAPLYRTRKIVEGFWRGLWECSRASLVTFNGRCFDLPLLELGAFRYGCSMPRHYREGRKRFAGHLDLCDYLTNYGACRLTGGLNLLSKMLGKPGKMDVSGDQVYEMYRAGRLREINEYCMADVLDTYFVFLRTRVLMAEMTVEREVELVRLAREWIASKVIEVPSLQKYLDNWGDWDPWP